MPGLAKFDHQAFARTTILSSLSMQTWSRISDFPSQLCSLLSSLKQLRILKLAIQETLLKDQLKCLDNPKIRHLEITGKGLKVIHPSAFRGFNRNPDLVLRIVGTNVEDLPNGLFSGFQWTANLGFELRDNRLTHLSPEVFYGSWKRLEATSVRGKIKTLRIRRQFFCYRRLCQGGLVISESNFVCGCHLAWLSHWLRRWAKESLGAYSVSMEVTVRINERLKQTTCVDATTGVRTPIVELPPEDMSCQASALSQAQRFGTSSVIFFLIVMCKYICEHFALFCIIKVD